MHAAVKRKKSAIFLVRTPLETHVVSLDLLTPTIVGDGQRCSFVVARGSWQVTLVISFFKNVNYVRY